MQPDGQQVHDDLASLFSRNLTLHPNLYAAASKEALRHELEPAPAPVHSQPIIYSVSQHYHHSAHAAKPAAPEKHAAPAAPARRPSSEPSQGAAASLESMLGSVGIDPATLTPSQLQLFRTADEPQKLRLVELWSICPPARAEEIPSLAWSSTSLEHEEHLARMRYQQQQQHQTMSLDGTPVQTADGRWAHQLADTEPYMVSGYEELMRRENERNAANMMPRSVYCHFGTAIGGPSYRPATDPAYLGPDHAREQTQIHMATQYGEFEQSCGDVDAMDAT